MPADRLGPIAARILSAQPYPPRAVSLTDIWAINWPLLLWVIGPGLLADIVIAFIPRVPGWVYAVLIFFELSGLAVWIFLVIAPHVIALRRGMPDSATVVDLEFQARGGYRGHLKLEHGPGTAPATFYFLTTQQVKVGDRLSVLVNPGDGKVMATLGPAEAHLSDALS